MNKTDLKKTLIDLSPEDGGEDIILEYIGDVAKDLSNLREQVDSINTEEQIESVIALINDLESEFIDKLKNSKSDYDKKLSEVESSITRVTKDGKSGKEELSKQITIAKSEASQFFNTSLKKIQDAKDEIASVISEFTEETKKENKSVKKIIDNLRSELTEDIKIKFSAQASRGGSMNRKITFGGVDYLTRYTDINYKAGSNVTFTVVQNNTTKQVDVTISSTGGGGGGTVRVISSISTDTAAGSSSGTDYVYLCTGTLTVTLPDAAANTNLYTIKNVGTGVVTIATTSAQTIDAQSSIQLGTQYTSVDIVSDTSNWNLT